MSFEKIKEINNPQYLFNRLINRDLFRRLLKNDGQYPSIGFADNLEKYKNARNLIVELSNAYCGTAEWFDFGVVSRKVAMDQIKTVNDIFEKNLFHIPYEKLFFSATWKHKENVFLSEVFFLAKAPDGDAIVGAEYLPYQVEKNMVLGIENIFTLEPNGEVEIVGGKTEKSEDALCRMCALWGILNTKNVPRTIQRRDKHEDRKRAEKKLIPLGNVTHINVRAYESALVETEKMEKVGVHASPRPHLRRGHIRTYLNGKKIWVHATIVNGTEDAKIVAREKYFVKTFDTQQ